MRLYGNRLFPKILNVLGLTLAFSIFLILTVQVMYDFGYDRGYPNSERIFRLEYSFPSEPGVYGVQISRPAIEYMKDNIPQAEAISCYRYYKGEESSFIWTGTDNPGIGLKVAESDFDLLKVFPFEFIEGDTTGFHAPWTAVISEKGARKLFGDRSPVGMEVQEDSPELRPYRIVAVYRDFPSNSSMDNEIILNMGDDCMDVWTEWSFPCYMKLSSTDGLGPTLETISEELFGDVVEDKVDFRLSCLRDIYFSRDIQEDNMAKGNIATTVTLLSVSILVLLIAVINFINFAMASVPFTIRSINTRRVLGASRSGLIWRQLAGALGLVMLSFGMGVAVMSALAATPFASYISGPIEPADNLTVICIGLGVAVLTAFLAGIIPARYSTSFPPALVLKGPFSLSAGGRRLRAGLVGFQFVVSFVLIICALFITVQIRYMKSHDMGFDREQILEFKVTPDIGENRETFRQMLLENPDILDVTFAGNRLVSESKMGWGRNWQGESVQMDCLPVDRNFISFFGMEMKEGRDFTESDDRNPSGTFIVNEAFMARYPFLYLGARFSGHKGDWQPAEIVGIVKDFNFKPMQYGISPIALYNFGPEPWWPLTVGYAKINVLRAAGAMDYIRKKCAELDPAYDPSYYSVCFMDEMIGRMYDKEERLNRLIITAAVISLLISIVGILGLVYLETQIRRREIALRRVHGAQVGEILAMLNLYYLKITCLCFMVAVPMALSVIRRWVSGFACQSPVPFWIFPAALLAISLITVVTVTLQSCRTALRNPSDSLRTE